ncbi:MAG TPA: DUF4349 domain-containing protein [Acidothermaceae bacterium]|jgi:hypothetical protein
MRHVKGSRIMTVMGVTAVLAILAAGCSSSEKRSASAPAAATTAGSAAGDDLTDVPASAPGGAVAAAPSSAAAPAAAASSAAAAPAAAGTGETVSQPLLTGRQVIFTADITVQTKDIKTAVDQVTQIANSQGGVVFGEQVNLASKDPNNPGAASATVTLKVPPDTLEQGILDQIGRLGTELSRNETASDITAQVVDVNSRIAAAQDSLTRLRQLFQHAGNVADLATVENEIAQREADLESLEAQQRTFAAQTAQATITVNLVATPKVAPVVAPVKKAHVVGFVRGLRGGWHAFTRTVTGITTAVGALLPFLIVLLVLGLAAFIVRRRLMTPPSDDATHAPSAGPAA